MRRWCRTGDWVELRFTCTLPHYTMHAHRYRTCIVEVTTEQDCYIMCDNDHWEQRFSLNIRWLCSQENPWNRYFVLTSTLHTTTYIRDSLKLKNTDCNRRRSSKRKTKCPHPRPSLISPFSQVHDPHKDPPEGLKIIQVQIGKIFKIMMTTNLIFDYIHLSANFILFCFISFSILRQWVVANTYLPFYDLFI